jgi:hypothetical protein
MLGREETWLAIPKIYLENVLTLYKGFHGANYEERRRIYAQIKGYLAPVTRSDIKSKRAEWCEELNLPIIINYNENIGIIRVD